MGHYPATFTLNDGTMLYGHYCDIADSLLPEALKTPEQRDQKFRCQDFSKPCLHPDTCYKERCLAEPFLMDAWEGEACRECELFLGPFDAYPGDRT